MSWSALKYLLAYSVPATVALALWLDNAWVWLPLIYAFGFIPTVELLIAPRPENLAAFSAELRREDKLYDWLLYLTLPIQGGLLLWFLWQSASADFNSSIWWGKTVAMGLLLGIIGINVGHELGHRRKRNERYLAKILLGTALYGHFYIEHNFGHHRNVATPEDPASARREESLYAFWWRSITQSYRHAWHLQLQMLSGKRKPFWSFQNDMLWFTISSLLLLGLALIMDGWLGLLSYFLAALLGVLLLETVNYIEHYGLEREAVNERRYENADPRHSWNSDHLLGRLVLFELSRHSDHHAYPHKKYQLLDHHDHSPQLPTGYPGMMLMAALPPLWFYWMHRHMDRESERLRQIAL